MMRSTNLKMTNDDLLLKQFNNREDVAFGRVYHLLYNELYYFTNGLYRDSAVSPKDIIQDVFIKILEAKSLKFESIQSLKGYLYVSIKNKFRNYIDHKKSVEKFQSVSKQDDHHFLSQVVEIETLSILTQAIDLLPSECAKVFRLHIEGWNVSDIASELGKSESTVYAQKQKAIDTLKKKLSKHSFSILFTFISIYLK